jgi:hypothetical protein
LDPALSVHCSHSTVTVAAFVQTPGSSNSFWPSCASPATVGGDSFAGAGIGAIGPRGAELAWLTPVVSIAVSCTTMYFWTSAGVSV